MKNALGKRAAPSRCATRARDSAALRRVTRIGGLSALTIGLACGCGSTQHNEPECSDGTGGTMVGTSTTAGPTGSGGMSATAGGTAGSSGDTGSGATSGTGGSAGAGGTAGASGDTSSCGSGGAADTGGAGGSGGTDACLAAGDTGDEAGAGGEGGDNSEGGVPEDSLCALPSEGLVAAWLFGAGSAEDSLGDHDGVVFGATTVADRWGTDNASMAFDGADDFIIIADDRAFDFGTGPFSVSLWVSTPVTTGEWEERDDLLAKGNPSETGFSVSLGSNKALFFMGPDSVFVGGHGTTEINDGQYHHVALIRGDNGATSLWVDGAVEWSGTVNQDVNTTDPVILGKHGTVSESYFTGSLDDIRVYNRALTAPEVEVLYSAGGWPRGTP